MNCLSSRINVKYFSQGKPDSNGFRSLIVPTRKVMIAGRNSSINIPGYAHVTHIDDRERCQIAAGYNIRFELPKSFENLVYDPNKHRAFIIQDTIEFWKAVDEFGSEFVICRYKMNSSIPYVSSLWYFDLICFYEDQFYLLNEMPRWSDTVPTPKYKEGYYEPFFNLIEKINIEVS